MYVLVYTHLLFTWHTMHGTNNITFMYRFLCPGFVTNLEFHTFLQNRQKDSVYPMLRHHNLFFFCKFHSSFSKVATRGYFCRLLIFCIQKNLYEGYWNVHTWFNAIVGVCRAFNLSFKVTILCCGHSKSDMHERGSDYLRLFSNGCLQMDICYASAWCLSWLAVITS